MAATRDMTKKQFREALSKHGFRLGLFGVVIVDGTEIGAVLRSTSRGWKVDRRATLSRAITAARRQRERQRTWTNE